MRNILVTGATQGIGYGVATSLLQKGTNVILVGRNEEKLLQLKNQFPAHAYPYVFDLYNTQDIESIFMFCKENGLQLNGMVHAAGRSLDLPIKSVDVEEMESGMRINYFSYVQLARYFSLKKYSVNGASIVAFSSLASFLCEKGMSQYASSKAAINAFTKTLSYELLKRNIRVNAIAPGYVDTDMTRSCFNCIEGFEEMMLQKQPWGMIPVSQIVELVEFLLSERSQYITGAIIPVSAGTQY